MFTPAMSRKHLRLDLVLEVRSLARFETKRRWRDLRSRGYARDEVVESKHEDANVRGFVIECKLRAGRTP